MKATLQCGQFEIDLSKPAVMGILNVTPDSFSDGGDYFSIQQAVQHALNMQSEGAAIIDVGGESTRPGAKPVNVQQELDRVIPVIEKITSNLDIPVSIDSSKPEVMREAVIAGASMINDVMALQQPNALETVASLDDSIAVCLMHMQGSPRTMQENPGYDDVVSDVIKFLQERVTASCLAGLSEQQIVIDPGFGFGKTLQHNIELLAQLERFSELDWPVLVGISRKSMIGALLDNLPTEQRITGSLAAAVMAYERGAQILRVHDVRQTVEALTVAHAVLKEK